MPNAKKKFIKSFAKLKELFTELNDEYGLTLQQLDIFNDAQAEIVNYFNAIEKQLEGPELNFELPWSEPEFYDAWDLWKKYKKQQFRFTYKSIGEQGALQDLTELSAGDLNKAISLIHQSIKKGWRGFFPQKQNNNQLPQNIEHKKDIFKRLTANQNEQNS